MSSIRKAIELDTFIAWNFQTGSTPLELELVTVIMAEAVHSNSSRKSIIQVKVESFSRERIVCPSPLASSLDFPCINPQQDEFHARIEILISLLSQRQLAALQIMNVNISKYFPPRDYGSACACIGCKGINRKTFYPENPVLLPVICMCVLYVRLHVCRVRNPDALLQRVAITRP